MKNSLISLGSKVKLYGFLSFSKPALCTFRGIKRVLKTSKQPPIITGNPLYSAERWVALLRTNKTVRPGKPASRSDSPLHHPSAHTGGVLVKQPCCFAGSCIQPRWCA